MLLAFDLRFLDYNSSGLLKKIAKILISDQARVNRGNNYEYPGQRWVPAACSIYHAVKRKHSLYKPGFKWADLEWFALNQP